MAKACSLHSTSLPLHLCLGCLDQGHGQALCEHCMEEHQCPHKSKGEVSAWVARQQERLSKDVMAVQK